MGNGSKKHNLCRGLSHEHVHKVSASSPFWGEDFEYFFQKFTLYVAMATNQIQFCFLFVLEFYSPVNNEVMSSQPVNSGNVPGLA